MNNKFTITFRQLPSSYINRDRDANKICADYCLYCPFSHVYIISGVRGPGN